MKKYLLVLIGILPVAVFAQKPYDVLVYGGTPAGITAAIQVAKMGQTVALLESGEHLGGIIVEGLGGTDIDNHKDFQNSSAVGGLALEFYKRIAKHYNKSEEFEEALKNKTKNPSLWRFEPHVAEQVITNWVAEYPIKILYNSRISESPDAVIKEGKAIRQITLENGQKLYAKMFIDATIEGDLLHAAGISTIIGREANSVYGETKNGVTSETSHNQFTVKVDPYKIPGDRNSGLISTIQDEIPETPGSGDHRLQAYCFRICLTSNPENKFSIPKPPGYDRTQYEIYTRYEKAGGRLYFPSSNIPNNKTDLNGGRDLSHNLYGLNYEYPGGTYAVRKQVLNQHASFTKGLLYFLTNDTAISQRVRSEWSKWGLSKDEFKDNNGWPRQFYVRDARRMVSDYVITEQHFRRENPTPVPDPVAIAFWPPDVHSVRRIIKDGYAYNEGFVFGGKDWRPFGISYRALVPRDTECTNILTSSCPSSSHIAYGAIRIEFTFMALGQACATAAVMANKKKTSVQQVNIKELQKRLLSDHQVYQLPGY